jgi:uncharacterized membrane protein
MQHQRTVSSALAAVFALGLLGSASAADDMMNKDMAKDSKAKEKCFGIAKAGQNDCANLSGTHSCAGQATMAGPDEWKYVAKGSCKSMMGMTADEAKMAAPKKM